MLGIARAPAESAPDADACIDLKSFGAVRVNQLDRRRPFPVNTILARIGVDARCRIEQALQIHHDRERRDRLQVILDGAAVSWIVDYVRIHAVIDHVPAPTARPAGWRCAVRRLLDDVVEEEIGLRIHI